MPTPNPAIIEYLNKLRAHSANLDDFKAIEKQLRTLTLLDIFGLFNDQLKQGQSMESILVSVEPFIHAIDPLLKEHELKLPEEGLIGLLRLENAALTKRLNALQETFKAHINFDFDKSTLLNSLQELESFSMHYVKIQNLIFPSLEKVDERFEGLRILWSMQDLTKNALKATLNALQAQPFDAKVFSFSLGDYFFKVFGLIQKENRFLLQAAHQYLTLETLDDLYIQSLEYPVCFIEKPKVHLKKPQVMVSQDGLFQSTTGTLSMSQVQWILDTLPLDITFIDENNKVRYFNNAKDRLFPRSPAVIGRDVRNCHPASSVHVVNEILDAFKTSTQREASFWIQMKSHFVYIRYLAIFDEEGSYKGTLEITQLVDDIRALSGERRLLQWDKN